MRNWWELTKAERAARGRNIIRALRDGCSTDEAAARFNLSPAGVYRIARRAGLRFGFDGDAGGRPRATRLRRAIAAAAESGLTAPEICARFGLPYAQVTRTCVATLAERRRLRARSAELAKALKAANSRRMARLLLDTDLTMMDISRQCRVSNQGRPQSRRPVKCDQLLQGGQRHPAEGASFGACRGGCLSCGERRHGHPAADSC